MPVETLQSFLSLAIGFAFAGVLSAGYQLAADRPVSFKLLDGGPRPSTFAAVPLLVFAAPFIIMRNTLRVRSDDTRRFEFAMLTTVIAGFWSLMSGTVVLLALQALGRIL